MFTIQEQFIYKIYNIFTSYIFIIQQILIITLDFIYMSMYSEKAEIRELQRSINTYN